LIFIYLLIVGVDDIVASAHTYTHTHTHTESVGLPRTSEQPIAETST